VSAKEKKRMLDNLTEAHLSLRETLDKADLEVHAYDDASWRIRDIVGHIATWERVVAKALRTYLSGSEYVVPNPETYEDEYNENKVLEQQHLSPQQILAEFEFAQDEFKTAIEETPVDRFPGDLLYPWGDQRGDIATMVEEMIEHIYEHQDEIKKAVQR